MIKPKGSNNDRHRTHDGYYSGRNSGARKFVDKIKDSNSYLEYEHVMKYSMEKYGSIVGAPIGLVSFFITNPAFELQYKYRKNALEHSRKKSRITEEQYNLRMIRLEESMQAYLYRNGYITEEQYEKAMDGFEEQYLGKTGRKK
jgi:hypothetical protein